MLKPIPTAHPAIMLVSLAILGTLIYFGLRGSLEPWVTFPSVIMIVSVSQWSLKRRKTATDRKYSKI
jgi:hypothetical protein